MQVYVPPVSRWHGESRLLIKEIVVNGEDQMLINSSKFSAFATILLSPIAFTQFIPASNVFGCATAVIAPRNADVRSIDWTHAGPVVFLSSAPTSISRSPFMKITNL